MNAIFSPVWWLTAVVAGVLGNLLSIFLVRRFDSIAGRFSARVRARSEARQQKHAQHVARLKADPSELALEAIRAVGLRLRAAECLVLAVAFLVIASMILLLGIVPTVPHLSPRMQEWAVSFILLLGGLDIFVGSAILKRAMSLAAVVSEARGLTRGEV